MTQQEILEEIQKMPIEESLNFLQKALKNFESQRQSQKGSNLYTQAIDIQTRVDALVRILND